MGKAENKPTLGKAMLGFTSVAAAFSFVAGAGGVLAETQYTGTERMQFTEDGELIRPARDSYRKWVFVGSNVTPIEENVDADGNLPPEVTFPGFHNTYMHPDDFDYFKKTGEYRDGTQFIQENVAAGPAGFSGKGHFQEQIWGNKASVRSKERFPDLPGNLGFFIWQDDYKDTTPLDSAPVGTIEECNQCHIDFAGDTDYVFEVHYPVLRDVKPKKEEKAE